jgi:Putative peptidoglycan binding domain
MQKLRAFLTLPLVVASGAFSCLVHADEPLPLIVQLHGRSVGVTRPLPPLGETGTEEGNCFNGELTDLRAGKVVGTGMYCLTNVETMDQALALTATTFFDFREGTLVSRNRTTVQPVTDGSPGTTHITGAIPAPLTQTILPDYGTGRFKNVSGSVRQAGALDMSRFTDKNELTLNNLYVITLADRRDQIRIVQKQLQEENVYPGAIDGLFGPQTQRALVAYQAKHGLPTTGQLDEATRKALGIQ